MSTRNTALRSARVLGVATVLATAAVTLAATIGGPLIASPNVGVAELTVGSPGTAHVTLSNISATTQSVVAVVQDAADCDDPTMTAAPQSFALANGAMQTMSVACNASSSSTMRRCLYHVQDAMGSDLATFLAVCESATSAAFSPSQSSLAFASVAVGSSQTQTVTLANTGPNASATGTLHLQLTDLGGNFLIGAPCNPNVNGCDLPSTALGSAAIDVICEPSSAATFTGSLYVSDSLGDRLTSPIALSCTGSAASGPALHVSSTPSPFDLRNVAVIGGSGSGNVHVQNAGTSTLSVSAIAVNGAGNDWTVALGTACTSLPCNLAPGGALDITVHFAPSEIGRRNATMTIVSNDPTNGQTVVQLSGIGMAATLGLAPGQGSAIDLGDVAKTATASVPLELVNGGDQLLTGVALALNGSSQFSISPPSMVDIPAGANPTSVMLTCAPGSSTAAFTTTFTATGSNVVGNTTATVNATCHGTDSSLLASPPTLMLGEMRTGTAVTPVTVTLKNMSSSELTLSGTPTLSPATSLLSIDGPSPPMLPPMGAAQFTVNVDTSSVGAISTTILVSDTSGDSIDIPVTGSIATASTFVAPTVSAGTFCVDQPTTPTTLQLKATGTAAIGLPSLPAMSMASSPFLVAAKTPLVFPAELSAGTSALVEVTPIRQRNPITVSDTLQWATDVTGAPQPTTTVSATFVATGAAVAPASVTFPDQPPHVFMDDSQPVSIQNCSGVPILLTPSIDPPFSIDANFPTSLAVGAGATFGVSFHPTRPGTFNGTLTVTTSGTSTGLTVALTGTGVTTTPYLDAGSSTGPAPGGTSFYACSCSARDPRTGWPIALAFVLVLRPRRKRERITAAISVQRRRGSS